MITTLLCQRNTIYQIDVEKKHIRQVQLPNRTYTERFYSALENQLNEVSINGDSLSKRYKTSIIPEALFYDAQDVLDGRKKIMRTKIAVDGNLPLLIMS